MIRNQFSYWLTVSQDANAPRPDLLQSAVSELTPPLQEFDIVRSGSNNPDPNTIEFSVNENFGTIEDASDDIFDLVSKTAARYPSLYFVLDENDEEDHSEIRRTLWHDKQAISSSAVLTEPLDAGELKARLSLDDNGIKRSDAAAYLKDAANTIRKITKSQNDNEIIALIAKHINKIADALVLPDEDQAELGLWEILV